MRQFNTNLSVQHNNWRVFAELTCETDAFDVWNWRISVELMDLEGSGGVALVWNWHVELRCVELNGTRTSVRAFSKHGDFIFTNEIFWHLAHGFLILLRNLLPHSFTAEIQFPVLRPISGLDLFNF